MLRSTQHYDELSARRATELDEIIDSLAQFAAPSPTSVDVMFESLLLAYAALRARNGGSCRVLMGQVAYDRAKASGLLAWCREQYPQLSFEPPAPAQRGPSPTLVILDEAMEF